MKGATKDSLKFRRNYNGKISIVAYCDADFAADIDTFGRLDAIAIAGPDVSPDADAERCAYFRSIFYANGNADN